MFLQTSKKINVKKYNKIVKIYFFNKLLTFFKYIFIGFSTYYNNIKLHFIEYIQTKYLNEKSSVESFGVYA